LPHGHQIQMSKTRVALKSAPSRARKRQAPPARKQALSREVILERALELCKNEPLQDISIVRIAREFGVTPGLVHYYLGGRDQLTSGVMNGFYRALLQNVSPVTGKWRADVEHLFRTIYKAYVRYAGIVAYLMSHNRFRLFQEVGPEEVDHGASFFERTASCLRQARLDARNTAMFAHLLLQHVLASGYQKSSRQLPGDHHDFLVSRMRRADSQERPDSRFILESFATLSGDAAFEAGLQLILDGMERDIQRNGSSRG